MAEVETIEEQQVWDDAWGKAEAARLKKIQDDLSVPFPKSAIMQRTGGGGKMLDYISGTTALHRLIRSTGGVFDVQFAFEPKFETMRHTVTRQGRKVEEDILVCFVGVHLTIPGLGTRAGIGVQKVQASSEDLFKGALTDAIKHAAKHFGMALELYGEDIEGKNAANF